MKNNYPRNFINKTLTKIRNKPHNNIPNEQPKQSRTRITLPYINNTSEMTARLLRPFNIDTAHKPTHKLRSYFTKHKDKTTTKQTKNAIYMIPCRDCPQRYIGQTSKKIETRITEHKNAIKRHDHLSLPAAHAHDNCHTFNWTETQLLGRAQTKHAREFKEAWYSIGANTINRHIEIPTIYLQLKTIRNNPTNKNNTMANDINFPITVLSTPVTHQSNLSNDVISTDQTHSTTTTHSSTTNQIRSTTGQPIRRSISRFELAITIMQAMAALVLPCFCRTKG